MEPTYDLETLPAQGCDCCQMSSDQGQEQYGCAERSVIFTLREQDVLKRIREAHERAMNVKERVRRFSREEAPDLDAKRRAMDELDKLRLERAELERERIAAAEERMRLLGHL